MRKNKLYTVNRWNRAAFAQSENIYAFGDWLKGPSNKLGKFLGSEKGLMSEGKATGAGALVGTASTAATGLVSNLIGGDYEGAGTTFSKVGGAIGNAVKMINPLVGSLVEFGSGTLGAIGNRLFGKSTDEEALKSNQEGINYFSGYKSNASTYDDMTGLTAMANFKNPYKGGLFRDVSGDNEDAKKAFLNAKDFAVRSYGLNAQNIGQDMLNNQLAGWYAYGGPMDFGGGALGLMQQNRYLDTIDKRSDALANKNTGIATAFTGGARTYADGGLETTFLDSFGTDPIGAAVRYNQGLEQLAAQREAEEAQAAREAEYADMQKRLANLETQNQGLQALMATQTVPAIPEIEEAPVSSSPSPAIRSTRGQNATWDYVEDQLKKSGKFNDIQIEGIKYNLQRESALNPDIVGDGGAAFGLAQWHGIRQPKDKSLEGQTRHLIETLSNFDGGVHWIGKNNYYGFMNARTPEEAHYYIAKGYERPRADIVAKVKRDSDMSLKRLQAFGGELGTNGTDFTNGLLWIDEGGSHEENPFDGVPMGVDAEGIPNLVEEGETVYNDYVFSDRMKVPGFMYKELGLGGVIKKKGKEMSFADASKKLAQESEQRPNDPISQAGLNAALSKLAEVQETERMKKNAEEYMGLEDYACGGKMKKYATGGKKGNMFWGWGDQPNYFDFWMPKTASTESVGLTPAELQAEAARQAAEKKATAKIVASAPAGVTTHRSSNNPYGKDINTPTTPAAPAGAVSRMTDEEFRKEFPMVARPVDEQPSGINWTDGSVWQGLSGMPAVQSAPQGNSIQEEYNPYPTWMRYAPVVGAGVMSLTDMLGLTNKPDYTMAGKLEAAAERAGYAPEVKYDPIGDYMRYTPLDRQYYINQLMANSRATDRALSNSVSPSKAAGLLASGYNTTLSLGNLARQAEEYNRGIYERTKEFNRKTNMFNSQMGLEAAMANARYRQQAQSLGLSGLAQAAALRDSIDQRIGAARSANLTNFLTSLGNIGRENFALNQINSDRSRRHGARANGTSYDKVAGKKSCGGKMKRR